MFVLFFYFFIRVIQNILQVITVFIVRRNQTSKGLFVSNFLHIRIYLYNMKHEYAIFEILKSDSKLTQLFKKREGGGGGRAGWLQEGMCLHNHHREYHNIFL